MNKFAKIESPSDEEKKHISEEAQYIDQPVADDIKIKKNINKRRVKNMYRNEYEGMVHEAYEDILGSMEKEAAPSITQVDAHMKEKGYTKDPIHGDATTALAVVEAAKKKGLLGRGIDLAKAHPYATAGTAAAALAIPTAAALIAKKKKKDAEEVAEKAAAYFDEAQLIKEAAANDYEVACAYEDAALSILGELGYFDEGEENLAYEDDFDYEHTARESLKRIQRNEEYFKTNPYEQKLLAAQIARDESRIKRAELRDAIRVAKAKGDDEEVAKLKKERSAEKGVRNRAILEGLNPLHNTARSFGRMATNPREAWIGSIGGGHDMNVAYRKAYIDKASK